MNTKVKIYTANTEKHGEVLTIECINNNSEAVEVTVYIGEIPTFNCKNIPGNGGRISWHVTLCFGESLFVESNASNVVTLVHNGI